MLHQVQGRLGLAFVYDADAPLDLYDDSAELYRALAETYLAADDPYSAAVEAARGVDLAGDDPDLWLLLDRARYRLADVDGAATALGRAAGAADQATVAWQRALLAVAGNRLTEARAAGQRALDLRPDPDRALTLAGWAAVDGDFGAAADAIQRFLALSTDDPQAAGYRDLAEFYRIVSRAPAMRIDDRVTRVQVNFDLKRGDEIPYVPMRFDGREPAYVLFDTGAEHNVIDRAYARSIGVGPIFPGGPLHGAYRATSPGGWAVVDSLQIGSLRLERVPFAVADFAALNLRGQGSYYIAAVINPALLFRDFVVVLDYEHRRIELIRNRPDDPTYVTLQPRIRRTTGPFVFDSNGVWPVLEVTLDGARGLPFLADTGASDILLDARTAGALRVDPQAFEAAAAGHARDELVAQLLPGPVAGPGGIDLHGILGFPFFRDMRVAFDYRAMQVVIEN